MFTNTLKNKKKNNCNHFSPLNRFEIIKMTTEIEKRKIIEN